MRVVPCQGIAVCGLTRRSVFPRIRLLPSGAVRLLRHLFSVGFATAAVAAWLPSPMWQGAVVEPGAIGSPGFALQTIAVQDQQPDTLELLLARIRDLESARDASQARIASLAESLAALQDRTERERAERNREMAELRGALMSLLDSLAATRTDLSSRMESSILSLRSEGEARSGALATRLDGIADDLTGVETARSTWRAEVYDSLGSARGEIAVEQERRRAGDSRNVLWIVIVAGVLLGSVGLVWWRAQTRAVALDSRVEHMRPERVQEIAKARKELVGASTNEARALLREQLTALERMSAVLAAIEEARSADVTPTPDHDLALGICNEVNRIENNLLAMDSKVRGHKQLRGCVRRVKENLHVEGYEITELRGRPYDGGMHVDADFVEDQALNPGQKLISRVTRPEIRFQNRIIQNAAVKVSVGF